MSHVQSGYPIIIKYGNRPKKKYVSEHEFNGNMKINKPSYKKERKDPILCYCYPKNNRSDMNTEQMILYPNSICIIGVDAWRDLDRHDCSSHPLSKMTLEDAIKKYDIISEKGGKVWTT